MSTEASPILRSGTVSSRTKSFVEGKKPRRTEFVLKHGQKHHTYDPEKAPYPLSYDRHVLELESLDNRLVTHLRNGSMTFVNFESGKTPERALDLGCGTGTWVIDAAKEWPNCEFIGFDLVNVQVQTSMLDPSISSRVSWVHGNFLTTKLPFDDDEFDHVHIQSIAKGVPENKWGVLFEEVNRVLRPEGSIEIIEDDIVFPSLPRWFTMTLRTRPRRSTSVHLPDGSLRGGYPSPPNSPSQDMPAHDHALLESLYTSVFEHRFINMKPSAVLPSYITTYFRHVTVCPVINFSMPPLPPPPPLPPQSLTSYANEPGLETFDSRSSTVLLSPASPASGNRPPSLSISSTLSTNSTSVDSVFVIGSPPRQKSTSFSSPGNSLDIGRPIWPSDHNGYDAHSVKLYTLDEDGDTACIPLDLFSVERLDAMHERSLAMHLYKSYQTVLACQEALWEELKDRLRNRRDELKPFGWDDDEELEELQNRSRFERLLERYKSDMETRVSLWCSLNNIGWPFPPRDPLSKAELIEEDRIRVAMLDARRLAPPDDLKTACRSLRVLVGYKL